MSERTKIHAKRNRKRFALSCPAFLRADLKAHLDGELAAPRRILVRWHLTHCADCREEFAWLRRLGEDMRDLEGAVPNTHLRTRILASPAAAGSVRFPIRAGGERKFATGHRAPRYALTGLLIFAAFGGRSRCPGRSSKHTRKRRLRLPRRPLRRTKFRPPMRPTIPTTPC